jgi:hypothetical protein
MAALSKLLQDWLPPRPRRWQAQSLATLYRVGDAAAAGEYARPADLAKDLERAANAALVRRRERILNSIVFVLVAIPFILLGAMQALARLGDQTETANSGLTQVANFLADALFVLLAPGAVLLGYGQGRGLIHHFRLRLCRPLKSHFFRFGVLPGLAQLALITAGSALVACILLPPIESGGVLARWFIGTVEILGFWLSGICLAGVVTFTELLVASLRWRTSDDILAIVGFFGSSPDFALSSHHEGSDASQVTITRGSGST